MGYANLGLSSLELLGSNSFSEECFLKIERLLICMSRTKRKFDFDKNLEKILNTSPSEEDIVVEYIENEIIEGECEEGYKRSGVYEIDEQANFIRKEISEYLLDTPCCGRNCCAMWKEKDIQKHIQEISNLLKTEKKLVILTILRNCAINSENTRYSEKRQRLRFSFRYEPFGTMCVSAFRALFGIRIESFRGLLAHLRTSNMSIIPPRHGNHGKKGNKSNQLVTRGITEKLVGYVLELGNTQGEFSPGRDTRRGKTKEDKNPEILWLPAYFTRSTILKMYNQQHPDFEISRSGLCRILDNETRLEHIKIRSPRTDMCDFCELQKRKIAGTKTQDELKAEELTTELAAHQKAYQGERNVYNSERKQSEIHRTSYAKKDLTERECIDHISIDYGQSIEVPHTADQLGGTFFIHMRKFLLFCVRSVLENEQLCYTYDEREAGKGANEVISFLHHFLVNRKIQTPNIRIHADNCTGQNKNKYVIWYLMWLVATGRLRHVELKFMIKGHTHSIIDGGIGQTKRELRRSDVFCLEHWNNVINRSASTNRAEVVNGNNVYDWKNGLRPYFKAFKGISQFQHLVIDSTEPGCVLAKYGFDDDTPKKRRLLKSDTVMKLEVFQNLPTYLAAVGFKGGNAEKEKALFDNLRQYVKDEWKDEICPNPETFKTPVREVQACPDWI